MLHAGTTLQPSAPATNPPPLGAKRPRVLHVVQPWSPPLDFLPGCTRADQCDASVLAAIEAMSVPGVEHSVLLLAGSQGAQRAKALGLRQFDRLAPAMGKPSLAARLFARYADERGPFDLVHLWGEHLARIEPWHPSIRAVALTNLEQGSLHLLSALGTRTTQAEGTLPPLSLSLRTRSSRLNARPRLREQFDLRDDDIALALIADPPTDASTARFTFLASLLSVSGLRVVAIVNSHGREVARGLADRRRKLLGRDPIIVDDPMLSFLPACDVAVFAPGTRFSDVPERATWRTRAMTSLALHLDVPVVTATTNLLPPQFEPHLLADSSHPAAIARVIARLCEDPTRQAAVRDSIESWCNSTGASHLSPLASRVHAAWASVLNLSEVGREAHTGAPHSDLVTSR